MRGAAKGYFLREYGSWSVLTISYLIGLGVSRDFQWTVVPLFLSLCLMINSKQAFMKWLRQRDDYTALLIFFGHLAAAAAVLVLIFRNDIIMLLPLLVFPAAYLASNRLAGEHFIVTELLGFVLLSLSAVLVKFLLTGGLDVRLFLGVAFYFTAGVFKVKALLQKKVRYRVLTVLYALLAVYVYHRMYIPEIILLPLAENLTAVAGLYTVRLQTTGWIEVAKSLAFLALFIIYY
jgi:hypothetical protein